VNVTVVVPHGKIAGALLNTATEPLTASVATGIGTATDVPDGPACSTVMGGGTPLNVGGVVSTTVTVVVAVALLPAASRAVNVTVVAPGGNIAGGLLDTATEPLAVSFAVGIGTATAVPDGPACSTVMGGGTPLNVGGVVSTTVTVVVAVALLPAASAAVNATVVTPRGKIAGALLDTMTEPLTVSFAVGIGTVTDAPDGPACSTVTGGGTPLSVGGVVSTTVTVVVAVTVLPAASRAVNVTVVAPPGKIAGALLDTATEPLTVSFAVGIGTVTDAPAGPVCSTVIGGGTPLNVGGVVSPTVTVVVAVALLPAASRAVNVTVVAPRGNVAGALLDTTTEPPQLSAAVGIVTVKAVPDALDGSMVTDGGTPPKVGAVTSRTVTTTVSDEVPPCPSLTVSVMV
jgi:hypothetical protein